MWRETVTARCFDVSVSVGVSHPALIDDVRDRLPPGATTGAAMPAEHLFSLYRGAGPRDRSRVYAGGRRVALTSYNLALLALEGAIRSEVARSSRQWLFVHAGVVAVGDRGIVLPGPSHAGKTHLVRALVRAGATYYSDELAVVDDEGWLHPYAKPLTIREPGVAGRLRLPASAFGGRAGVHPVRAGLIVATRYDPSAPWLPRPLTPGEATVVLLGNTLETRMAPAAALRRLGKVAAGAAAIDTARGDADAAAAAILDRLDHTPSTQREEVVTKCIHAPATAI